MTDPLTEFNKILSDLRKPFLASGKIDLSPCLKESVMASLSPHPGVSFNDKSYAGDVSLEVKSLNTYPYEHKVIMTARKKDHELFPPMLVNYKNTTSYRREVMDQQVDVLTHRVAHLFPLCTGWTQNHPEFDDDPDDYPVAHVYLLVRWDTHSINVGPVIELMWMNDENLKVLIQKGIDEKRREIARASDPLFLLGERLTKIGYPLWRVLPAQRDAEHMEYGMGDPLISVKCPTLRSFDQYVVIGDFASIKDLSEECLKEKIKTEHQRAINRYDFGMNGSNVPIFVQHMNHL